jgi:hypothetical protein
MRQDVKLLLVLGVFAELPKETIRFAMSVCLFVRMQKLNNHWEIFIKCDIGVSVEILSRKFEFNYSLTSITVTVHNHLRTVTITSRSTLLRMRNVLEKKLYRKSKHNFVFN